MLLPSSQVESELAEAPRFRGAVCDNCRRVLTEGELDSDRICSDCRKRIVRQIRIGMHVIALLVTLPFAVWVLTLDKSDYFPGYAWLIPLAAAYYLGLRIGREAMRGYVQWRGTR